MIFLDAEEKCLKYKLGESDQKNAINICTKFYKTNCRMQNKCMICDFGT